jgi:hypothetical protein
MLIWWKQTQTPHRKTKNLYQTLIKGLVWEWTQRKLSVCVKVTLSEGRTNAKHQHSEQVPWRRGKVQLSANNTNRLKLKMAVFRVVAPCRLVWVYQTHNNLLGATIQTTAIFIVSAQRPENLKSY